MSISVDLFSIALDGHVQVLTSPGDSERVAGIEECRLKLWGSGILNELGLRLLPTLKESDLFVRNDNLTTLKSEVQVVISNVKLISESTNYAEEYILSRTRNILNAIAKAGEVGAGIVIW